MCLALALVVSLGSVSALADAPPSVTIANGVTAEYTTAEVSGTVNPAGGPSTTYWHFEYTTTPADDSSWLGGPGGEIAGPAAEGTSPIPVQATLESLQPATQYSVRLVAENQDGANRVVTSSPYPTFTTKGPIAKATVTFDPVTTFTDTTAHFSGTIDPNALSSDPGFKVNYEFHCVPACTDANGNPIGGQLPADSSVHTVEADVTGLEPNVDYSVTLFAVNAGGSESAGPQSFHTTAVGPSAETISAFALGGGTEALVGGRINPHNAATTYWIEYGTTGSDNSAPVGEDAPAGSGGDSQIFTQRIGGLTPATTYHFHVVAENAFGQVSGSDLSFETAPAGPVAAASCPNATLRVENNSTALPRCRAYEQVSPIDKNGFEAGANASQPNYVAAEEGSAVAYESFGSFADAQSGPLLNEYLARRGPTGWTNHALMPRQVPSSSSNSPVFYFFSPDLRYGTLQGGNTESLAPGDNPDFGGIYVRDNLTDTYRTLNIGQHDGALELGMAGMSADGSRVFFSDAAALTPDAIAGADVDAGGGPYRNMYEWHDGALRLVSIRPKGEPSPGGAIAPNVLWPNQNQVSPDGSRVVFFDLLDRKLYLREGGVRTLPVSDSQRAIPVASQGYPAIFQGASEDLSKIFFTSVEPLTDESQDSGYRSLYMYDVATKKLTDLLASKALPGETVSLEGQTAAVADSGEYLYFRSNTRFHPGENQDGRSALYVWHNGTITFVANDETDADLATRFNAINYRVSPDGRRLSFSTTGRLTSYDNAGQSEVYTYDAATNRLVCVSCNPSGEPPAGSSYFPPPTSRQALNFQPGVGDDGHIFFNSSDALVPQDVNGKGDVYEWDGGRVHLISSGTDGTDSFYASSSLNGDDIYFMTRERLVATDRDDNEDLYDARVGGGFPQAVAPNPCEGIEGCHGPAGTVPSFPDPASGSFSSPLTQPSPSAQRLRKALKACKRKPRKKRAKCRVAAKKRYGKASNGRAH